MSHPAPNSSAHAISGTEANPVWLAIDTPDRARALSLARAVAPHIGGYKLGLEFFIAHGRSGYEAIEALGKPIFLDLKFHDIPNTVGSAIAALKPLAPAILTVHAAGGKAMMEAAKAAAAPGTKVVAVTMLTSLDSDDLTATGVEGNAEAHVERLARLARAAGLDGIVCSGVEVARVRAFWPEGHLVVPGLRPDSGYSGDQKRAVTPAAARGAGASVLVIGRPISAAPDPAAAIAAIKASL